MLSGKAKANPYNKNSKAENGIKEKNLPKVFTKMGEMYSPYHIAKLADFLAAKTTRKERHSEDAR
jgi:hypothetical protein